MKVFAINLIRLFFIGNAKTLHNNNSSRFCKYIQIYFDSDGNLIGCNIKSCN